MRGTSFQRKRLIHDRRNLFAPSFAILIFETSIHHLVGDSCFWRSKAENQQDRLFRDRINHTRLSRARFRYSCQSRALAAVAFLRFARDDKIREDHSLEIEPLAKLWPRRSLSAKRLERRVGALRCMRRLWAIDRAESDEKLASFRRNEMERAVHLRSPSVIGRVVERRPT